jgi:hypothetical protein
MKNPDKVKMGKSSRAKGKAFELKVKADLEKQGWLVIRWDKNVEFEQIGGVDENVGVTKGKLIQAKHQFNPFTKSMTVGHGFPDFICLKVVCINTPIGKIRPTPDVFEVQLVECKMNGKLDKLEKEKSKWLIDNLHILFYIAKKGEKRGEIIYEKFE